MPLNELDCSSLESRRLPGVHVCGELCDVFGRIGGERGGAGDGAARGRLKGGGAVRTSARRAGGQMSCDMLVSWMRVPMAGERERMHSGSQSSMPAAGAGFNFYFAFVSGRLAGLAAAEGAAAAGSSRRMPSVGAQP